MEYYTNKKNNNIIVIVITIIILILSILAFSYNKGLFYNNDTLSNELKSTNTNSKFVANLLSNKQVIVHYPVTTNIELNKKFKSDANNILKNINKDDYNNKYINIDYKQTNYLDYFTIKYNSAKLYNINQDNTIILDNYFDKYLKDYINNEIIYNVKKSNKYNDLVNTLEFYDNVYNNKYLYNSYLLEDKLIIEMKDNLSDIIFDINIKDISSHIDLELGIKENTNINNVRRRYIDPNKPMVAFTFDDGPYSVVTDRLLEEMLRIDAVGTFYVLGNRLFDTTQEDTINNMLKYGNDIGNHSVSHPRVDLLRGERLEHELFAVNDYMLEHFNYDVKTFRPPYGAYNKKVEELLEEEIILWDVDSLDWKYRETDPTYNEIMNNVKDGSIILLHDLYDTSVDAALLAMKDLLKQGYQFVTVDELLEIKKLNKPIE